MGFIKWWWSKRAAPEKFFLFVIFDLFVSVTSMPFLGVFSFIMFMAIFLLALLVIIARGIIQSVKGQLDEYRTEKETEAQQIIGRLRGDCENSDQWKDARYREILDKLKKRACP
jgi:hypothetical protein